MSDDVYENDPAAVQAYAAGLIADADTWDEAAAKARAAAGNLRGAAKAWAEEWVPEGAHGKAVNALAANLDAFAEIATKEAERLRTRSSWANRAAVDGEHMDEGNADTFRDITTDLDEGAA